MSRLRNRLAGGTLVLVVWAAGSSSTLAADPKGDLSPIRALFREANEQVDGGIAVPRRFFDSSTAKQQDWQPVEPRKVSAVRDAYRTATVFLVNGKVIRVDFDEGSPAEDFRDVTEYYFYRSGRTAFMYRKCFSAIGPPEGQPGADDSGPFVVETRQYFSEEQRQLQILSKAYDSPTGHPVKPDAVPCRNAKPYMSVSELPFAKELSAERK